MRGGEIDFGSLYQFTVLGVFPTSLRFSREIQQTCTQERRHPFFWIRGEGRWGEADYDLTKTTWSRKETHLALLRCMPVRRHVLSKDDVRRSDESLKLPRLDSLALRDQVVRERLILVTHPCVEELSPVLARERVVLGDLGRVDEGRPTLGAGECEGKRVA